MKNCVYRLGEYKIIETDIGVLHWEAHSGIGMQTSGKCFIKGDILFLGPVENQQEGFLKLEFLDSFKYAPFWLKTRYFLTDLEIFHCPNWQKVTVEEMLLWQFEKRHERNDGKRFTVLSENEKIQSNTDTSFRLDKYKISIEKDGALSWSSFTGANIIKKGPCVVAEDIIFLGPPADNIRMKKRQFTDELHKLSEWGLTRFYCPRNSLEECDSANQIWSKKKSFIKRRSLSRKKRARQADFIENQKRPIINDGDHYKNIESGDNSAPPVHHNIKSYIFPVILFFTSIFILSAFLLTHSREHRFYSHKNSGDYLHRSKHRH